MTPLRNNLESAKREYEATRYRGNLALDVLGPNAASHGNGSSRGYWSPLAIAAALAIGLGVGLFAGRSMGPTATQDVAKESPTTVPAAIDVAVTNPPGDTTPTNLDTTQVPANEAVAEASDEAADGAFTVVPSAELADASFTVVPDLASLTSDDASTDTASASDAIAFVPMSLMLLSVDEYGDQQTALDAAKKTTSDSSDPSSTTSEERS